MALLLEFSDYLKTQEDNRRRRNTVQQGNMFEANVVELVRALEMLDITPLLENSHSQHDRFTVNFTMKASCGLSAFYRIQFEQKSQRMELSVDILQRGAYCRLRSS
jgi:hypothetical protein